MKLGAHNDWPKRGIVIAIFAAQAIVLLGMTLIGDVQPGNDTQGHLFKAWAFARQAEQSLFSPLAWTNDWYVGHPLFHYYPPASTYILGYIDFIVGNMDISYLIFVFMVILVGSFGAYKLGRLWLGEEASVLVGLLYTSAPYTVKMIFWEGNLPRTAAVMVIPIVAYLMFRFLSTGRIPHFAGLSISIALLVVCHPMSAVSTLSLIATIGAVYGIFNIPSRRLLAFGASIAIGLALSAFWLLPSTLQADLPANPDLTPLREWQVGASMIPYLLFNPNVQFTWFDPGNTYVGLALVFVSIGTVVYLRRNRVVIGLVTGTAALIVLSMGINTPVYDLFTVLQDFLPVRFLQPVALSLAITAGFGFHALLTTKTLNRLVKYGAGAVLVALIAADSAPYYLHTIVTPHRSVEVVDSRAIGEWLAENRSDERRLFGFSRTDGTTNYLPISLAGIPMTSGWDPVGTPQTFSISKINHALANDEHGYILRTLGLWDVGYALTDGGFPPVIRFEETLIDRGWEDVPMDLMTSFSLLRKPPEQGGRIMVNPLPIASIGFGGRAASVIAPNVADWNGYTPVVEEQDLDYLSMMDGVLLTGARYESIETSEQLLRPILDRGITVYEEIPASAGARIFDIAAEQIRFSGPITVMNAPGVNLVPESGLEIGSFGYQGSDWASAVISSGADPLLTADINGESHVVAAVQNVGEGEVIYIGLSLLTHADSSGDKNSSTLIKSLLDYDPSELEDLRYVETTDLVWNNHDISFSYTSKEDSPTLLSLTYFPAWTAKLDGETIPVYRHERLTLLDLPSGTHKVELSYGRTSTQTTALIYSFIAGLLLLGIVVHQSSWRSRLRINELEDFARSGTLSGLKKAKSQVMPPIREDSVLEGSAAASTDVVEIDSLNVVVVYDSPDFPDSSAVIRIELPDGKTATFSNVSPSTRLNLGALTGTIRVHVVAPDNVTWKVTIRG